MKEDTKILRKISRFLRRDCMFSLSIIMIIKGYVCKSIKLSSNWRFYWEKGLFIKRNAFHKSFIFSILSYFVVQNHNGYENIVDDVWICRDREMFISLSLILLCSLKSIMKKASEIEKNIFARKLKGLWSILLTWVKLRVTTRFINRFMNIWCK